MCVCVCVCVCVWVTAGDVCCLTFSGRPHGNTKRLASLLLVSKVASGPSHLQPHGTLSLLLGIFRNVNVSSEQLYCSGMWLVIAALPAGTGFDLPVERTSPCVSVDC